MLEQIRSHVRAVLLVTFGLTVLGAYSMVTMPVAIFPKLTIPRIIVAADGGDAPAQSVLVRVTQPLEQALSTVPNLELLESQTTRGSMGMTLTFTWGTDVDQALQFVNARIAEARTNLPGDLTISSERLNPTVFPILDYSITSTSHSLAQLRDMAMYTLRPRLARLPGVARVIVDGGEIHEFQVTVSPDRLAAHKLSVSQVEDALSKANMITAVGNYDNHYQRNLVLVSGLLTDPESIARVVVETKDRVPITVGDVASVDEAIQRQTVLATGTGRPAVLLNIVRQPAGNTIEVSQEVKDEIAQVQKTLPHDVQIHAFYDQSQIVQESENSVIEAILVGSALALGVLVFFLGSARVAGVALSLLPLTMIITFSLLKLLGLDLNIMTLGGLAVALGLVVDDSIVVVEHIYHHLERGLPRSLAVPQALREIAPAMFSSSAASMVTFLPLVFLPGVTGNFFSALAITLITALFVSLVLALILCPTFALRALPEKIKTTYAADRPSGDGTSQKVRSGLYAPLASACLSHKGWVMFGLIPLVAGAVFLGSHLKTGFMPEFDEGAFVIDYKMPPGTSLKETDRVMRQVEDILARDSGVDSWSRLTGAQSGSGLEITPQNQGDILVRLKSGKRPPIDDITADLRTQILTVVPNVELDFAQILGDLIGDMSGSPSPVEVKIFGPDMNTLTGLAREVGQRITSIHGVVDENDGIVESGPQTTVQVDPIRAAEAGLSTDTITAAARAALDGDEVGSILKSDVQEPIRVKYPGPAEPDMDAKMLANMPLLTPTGQQIPLSSVADVRVENGTPDLNRQNQRLEASVTARLEGIDLGAGVAAVKKKLADLALPPGYTIEYGGLYKSQQESFRQLSVVLLTAILLVVSVLVISFRSFRIAFSLLAAAVLSLSGVVAALFITGTPLNISSFTGAIMIVGIVTENGVLLFDEYQRLQRSGADDRGDELLVAAGKARLRPILMTTFAAILTLFPLSLGIGAGAAMQRPLAIAVIGGLALSTAFTLIVAPVIYSTLTTLWRRRHLELDFRRARDR